ncbi:MAG: glutamine amidotransferase, partial [Abditibacteriales bacterium]|nr:glutamine amidotransferase [Abditibacteriales bacterium]MDW8368592.1 glutamine amidotransferase [Abditibacteriales bacterium]
MLIRLNTRDEYELRGGFPKLPEDLYAYHAVILDDVESEFFSHDQMALLEKFVSERGGGFLMLGGAESFRQGRYERTPVAHLLPVYLDRIEDSRPLEGLKLNFTREGWLQPWARLRSDESEEKARLEEMPPFQVLNRVRDIKPGASVIATVTDARGGQHPAIVVQRYGHGRVGAVLLGDVWRWGMRDELKHRDMD